ncbi:MAG: cell wall-binding protein, partial [Stomatobaculum sp.]
GKLLKADSDNKIEIINIDSASSDYLKKMTVAEFIEAEQLVSHPVGETEKKIGKASTGDTVYGRATLPVNQWDKLEISGYAVVNTAGAVVKSGTKKDGEGFKVVVSNGNIQQIIVED